MASEESVSRWIGQLQAGEHVATRDCAPSTIERRLRLIRDLWAEEHAS